MFLIRLFLFLSSILCVSCSTYDSLTLRLYNAENNKYGNAIMNCYFDNFMPGEMFSNSVTNYRFNIQMPLGVLVIENRGRKNAYMENLTSSKWNLVIQTGSSISTHTLCRFWNTSRYDKQMVIPANSGIAIIIGKNDLMPHYSVYQQDFAAEQKIWVEYIDHNKKRSNSIYGRYITDEVDESFSDIVY